MNVAQHCQVRRFRLTPSSTGSVSWSSHQRGPGGHSRGGSNRDPGRPPPGVARPGWSGWPGRCRGAGPCRQRDRHHGRVAARPAQRPRRDQAAEVRHPGPGPVLAGRRAGSARSGVGSARRVGEHRGGGVVEHEPHTSASASACRSPAAGGRPRRSAARHGRRSPRRSRRTSPASSNRPSPSRPRPGSRVRDGSFTRGRGAAVGLLTVLIQRLDQRGTPVPAARRGVPVGLGRPARACRARPTARAEPPRRLAGPAPGRSPRRAAEPSGQPRTPPPSRATGPQHGSVQPRARRDLLGSGHPAAGLEPLPARAGRSTPAPATGSRARRTRRGGPTPATDPR